MNFPDVRTVMFSHIITDALCVAVMALLWISEPEPLFRDILLGAGFWVADHRGDLDRPARDHPGLAFTSILERVWW